MERSTETRNRRGETPAEYKARRCAQRREVRLDDAGTQRYI